MYLCVVVIYILYFFFSSRRRHTRYIGDWSSDVCSSDLVRLAQGEDAGVVVVRPPHPVDQAPELERRHVHLNSQRPQIRSEERRVGKECRSRRSPYHYKTKKK